MEHAGAIILPDDPEATDIGLGTPATRAEIIETIIDRNFARRIGKKAIVPTDTGIKLIKILPEKLTSPVMTVDWEKQLSEIAGGTKGSDSVMSGIRQLTSDIVSSATVPHTFGPAALGKCPICDGNIYEGKTGKNYYCQNKTCDFNVSKKSVTYPFISPSDMIFLLKNGTLKKAGGEYTLLKVAPYIQFEKAALTPIKVDEAELTEFLHAKGISPVSKVAHNGHYYIPGGFGIKSIIQEINLTFHIPASYYKDIKALNHHPGWLIKRGWFNKKGK